MPLPHAFKLSNAITLLLLSSTDLYCILLVPRPKSTEIPTKPAPILAPVTAPIGGQQS